VHTLEMGPRVTQHNVAGCWMDTSGEQTYGISAAATSILTTVPGDNLVGDLGSINRPIGAG